MTVLNVPRPAWMTEELVLLEEQASRFVAAEYGPHLEKWHDDHFYPREVWTKAGQAGLLCAMIPEEYGGSGGSFAHEVVINRAFSLGGFDAFGAPLHSGIVAPYIWRFGTEEQKKRWLPKLATGELVGAIAMSEPGTGSDLQNVRTTAVKKGNRYVLNGSKTFITNGQHANLIVVVAKTDPKEGAKGVSLMVVETDDAQGFRRGRKLKKLGLDAADTSELFFEDVRVPITNALGEEGKGFAYLMNQLPQERLQIAIAGQAGAQRAFDEAVKFTKERKAFKQTVFDFQNTRFTLGTLKSKLQAGWAHLDWCIARHLEKKLTAAEASAAKLFHTELQWEVCDAALQLHGGAGYMNEYLIARLWRDARVTRIFGGTNEIMKEVVSRSI
jgi:acyl-CoA dehydrogenase